MTKLLFVLDENTLAALEIPRPAAELAQVLRRGDALPEAGAFNPEGQTGWRVLQLGGLVIVAMEPGTTPPPDLLPALDPPLSPRQREMLNLLRQGLTTRQIALRLKITIRTVHFHVTWLPSKPPWGHRPAPRPSGWPGSGRRNRDIILMRGNHWFLVIFQKIFYNSLQILPIRPSVTIIVVCEMAPGYLNYLAG